ncbi:MAG: hypothetical protein KDK06_12195 [Gammaproteobacteria bacterium]|nr:hypothetical protein [Gammaproteobacteria bacterium]
MTRGRHAAAARAWLALFAAGLVTALIYWPGLAGGFILDDAVVVQPLVAAPAAISADTLLREFGPLGRPVSMLSFLLNARVADGLAAWKAVNLALHLVTGLLVFLLARCLFARVLSAPGQAAWPAVFTAAVWLVHPLFVSTTLYTYQRQAQLAALFSLLALLFYLRARAQQARGETGLGALFIAAGVCTPLAALSKENGALVPLYWVLLEGTVLAGTARPAWLTRSLWLGGAAALLGGGALLVSHYQTVLVTPYTWVDYSLAERLLTQCRVVPLYLGLLLLPRLSAMGFYHDDLPLSHGLLDPPTTLGGLLLIVALVVTALRWRRRRPLASFGIGLFLAGQVLESSVFQVEMMFEHRTYLPAVGLFLALTALALELPLTRLVRGMLATTAVMTFVLATAARVASWSSTAQLYTDLFVQHPQSLRARVALAEWLAREGGEVDTALALLDGIDTPDTALLASVIDCRHGRDAGGDWQRFERTLDGQARASNFVAGAMEEILERVTAGACALDATAVATTAARVARLGMPDARRFHLYYALARLHEGQGDYPGALAALEAAAASQPDQAMPWFLAAEWAADRGRAHAARNYFERGRAIDPEQAGRFAELDEEIGAE